MWTHESHPSVKQKVSHENLLENHLDFYFPLTGFIY